MPSQHKNRSLRSLQPLCFVKSVFFITFNHERGVMKKINLILAIKDVIIFYIKKVKNGI